MARSFDFATDPLNGYGDLREKASSTLSGGTRITGFTQPSPIRNHPAATTTRLQLPAKLRWSRIGCSGHPSESFSEALGSLIFGLLVSHHGRGAGVTRLPH